ncbi:hypothetical protein MJO28_001344 [Puccinia striiformis f. sp. tritici]|uniref:Mediator of RNA polymerase II transcription subunit 31 n=3 Tax=Puccinia striiformis TaxID=27350 RepID=A0A0L0UPS3_9BASI|nr:hypothetical protein Pst134EA_003396 [Puccinia striiformis f. sp. tritici]KAI9611595.1 hypothetical protein H4Q26_008550 [Puccinia striiformis f. sp. tritici PST-130]KNE89013.1 hypothetical protein PSTG_17534 [Puccinia striiformis f. sp. tritici PST-78]KAH9472794.1 hypothetical protein Pst134EA_003396 [Puccinia striiformis f. sp. tritici]KAI7960855.1 hypothetical protein MJO28_001344 [Puccinia striiformis f. sp. tritici]KAI7965608.1 hypothetical protein MJO29_001356 [Puccinia striiformis f.
MASNSINAAHSPDLQQDKEANQVRFEEDLEFVQSLANPHFMQELTLNGTLRSETMINYLQYLKYFHDPNYARFVRYPNALKILDLLNNSEEFRTMIETQEHAQLLTDKFIQNWISLSGRLSKTGPTEVVDIIGKTRTASGQNGLECRHTQGEIINGDSP